MIAIISSTIYPPSKPIYDAIRTRFSPEERLEQTRHTVQSLLAAGLDDIYLADNSGDGWILGTEEHLRPARVHVYTQHQYTNKGISELWLLSSLLKHIPANTPLLKISGRYILTAAAPPILGNAELGVKLERLGLVNYSVSTRCYVVKDKEVYETFLKRTLCAVYGYWARIVGPRSFGRILKNSIMPKLDDFPYDDPSISIEVAAAHVLRKYNYRVAYFKTIGIKGALGATANVFIEE